MVNKYKEDSTKKYYSYRKVLIYYRIKETINKMLHYVHYYDMFINYEH